MVLPRVTLDHVMLIVTLISGCAAYFEVAIYREVEEIERKLATGIQKSQ